MGKMVWIFGGLVLVSVALWYGQRSVASATQQAHNDVATARVGRASLALSAVAIGAIKPKVGAEVKVGSQLSGVVAQLNVGVGDQVRKGQLLAMLDDSALQARIRALTAGLNAEVAEQKFARAELERFERLGPNIARLQLESSRRNAEVREARVAQARASLAEVHVQLAYARIVAPIDGTIASVSTYEGETVAASFAAPTFVTIVDLGRLEIQAYVDENDIGMVRLGQPVTIRVDAYPGQPLDGQVTAIYPKAQLNSNVVNYVVLVNFGERHGLQLRPEMTAHVTFPLDQRNNVIAVPRSALLKEGQQEFVIAQSNGQWTKRSVKTGLRTAQQVEVVANLDEGAIIAVNAQQWKKNQMETTP